MPLTEDAFHFEVEDSDLERICLDHAFMVSRQGRGVAASFDLDRDRRILTARIRHQSGTASSAALVLQVTLPQIGTLKLRTTQLLPRSEPYALMIELARERLRQYLQKCEDWQMFAPALAANASGRFQLARERLAQAVLAEDRSERMEIARDSIIKAVEAGELLATRRADLVLRVRYGNAAAADTTLGYRIDPRVAPPDSRPTELREFGLCMIETPLDLLQPEQGRFSFTELDRWMDWAEHHRMPIILGPLADLRPEALPEWAHSIGEDYTALCSMLWEHTERLVARYGKRVVIWAVSSGVHVNRLATLTNDQMIDLTRRLSVLVRQVDRSAKVLVELVQPFDDDVAACPGSVPAFEYATRTLDEGVHVDCFGLRVRCGFPTNGSEARDLLSLSDALDRFARLERPMLVTGLSAPRTSEQVDAGCWHGPWTEDRQSQWASSLLGITLGKMTIRGETAKARPIGAYEGVLWSNLLDGSTDEVGLMDASGRPRRLLSQLSTIRHALRRPLRSESHDAPSLEDAYRVGPS
ncbi:MAG: endo-1,4-beta-xylanase [Planctomycetota bacterium]|nr:endo-1,4-beta-xylanase [Planctomycetota bacterium]